MAELDVKKTLVHILEDTGTIVVRVDKLDASHFPVLVPVPEITDDYVCVKEVLSNPGAQTADWRVTTSEGAVEINADYDNPTSAQSSAAIGGATDVVLYLNPTTKGGKSGVTVINATSFSSLPKTVTNSSIKESHVVARTTLSNPSVQTGDWSITTGNGTLTIDANVESGTPTSAQRAAAINGSTIAELYLINNIGEVEATGPWVTVEFPHGSWQRATWPSENRTNWSSESSYHWSNRWDTAKVIFSGFSSFSLKIGSYAESTYDYMLVSTLNNDYLANCTDTASMRSVYNNETYVKAYTRGKQSATDLEIVLFDNLDPMQEYYFYVIYQKDNSTDSNYDKGWFELSGREYDSLII